MFRRVSTVPNFEPTDRLERGAPHSGARPDTYRTPHRGPTDAWLAVKRLAGRSQRGLGDLMLMFRAQLWANRVEETRSTLRGTPAAGVLLSGGLFLAERRPLGLGPQRESLRSEALLIGRRRNRHRPQHARSRKRTPHLRAGSGICRHLALQVDGDARHKSFRGGLNTNSDMTPVYRRTRLPATRSTVQPRGKPAWRFFARNIFSISGFRATVSRDHYQHFSRPRIFPHPRSPPRGPRPGRRGPSSLRGRSARVPKPKHNARGTFTGHCLFLRVWPSRDAKPSDKAV
jgi:hypothetical protein